MELLINVIRKTIRSFPTTFPVSMVGFLLMVLSYFFCLLVAHKTHI